MKIRSGFVSNSSTASFVISKSQLTPQQISEILNSDKLAGAKIVGDEVVGVSLRHLEDYAYDLMDRLGISEEMIEWNYE